MTTISSAPTFEMEFLQPEDTMELASSPHMPHDDLDLDLDTMHESAPASEDTMLEDADEDEDGSQDHVADDEMVDEDAAVQLFPDNASDLTMEHYHEHPEQADEEEILYEDEDGQVDQQHDISETVDAEQDEALDLGEADEEDAVIHEEEQPSAKQTNRNEPVIQPESPTDAVEELLEHPSEYDQDKAAQLQHPYEELGETITEDHLQDQAKSPALTENTAELGLELPDTTTDTNLIAPTDSLPEAQSTGQTATDHISLTAEDVVEHFADPVENQCVAIHTVKVIYQDSEICLFPPQTDDGTETFFVSDSNLAHESLEKLLTACREVLADTIGVDDELVLDVASLGLHISEGSKYASEITLAQILDVYLTLSHNENIENVEPLYCNLSSRVCLASQYAYLTAAAQQGKTITEIIAEHVDSPELEEVYETREHVEEVAGDDGARAVGQESELAAPEHVGLDYTRPDGRTTDAKINETGEVQTQDRLETTGATYMPGEIETGVHEDSESFDHSASHRESGPEEEGVQPEATEYKEDIDKIANEDYDEDAAKERKPAGEENFHTLGTNDETASSDTVEAEGQRTQEWYLDETTTQADDHGEAFASDLEKDPDNLDALEARDQMPEKQDPYSIAAQDGSTDPLQLEDDHAHDLVDPGLEYQGQPPASEADSAANDEGEGSENADERDDFVVETDASTDQTLENTLEDEEEEEEEDDDVNTFLAPVTPSKMHDTRSAKRKVEADEEDDFGLLDTETPDKKRRRPS